MSVYDENGFVESLPNITFGRFGAACGYYLDDNDNKVIFDYHKKLGLDLAIKFYLFNYFLKDLLISTK